MAARFPRTYADAEGGSHFDTVEDAFAPTAFVPTNPPLGSVHSPPGDGGRLLPPDPAAGTARGTRRRGRSTR